MCLSKIPRQGFGRKSKNWSRATLLREIFSARVSHCLAIPRLSAHEESKTKATYPAPCTCLLEMEMGMATAAETHCE